jgi:hypothetical protein
MTKQAIFAQLKKLQLLERRAIEDEIFNSRAVTEEEIQELKETEKKDLTKPEEKV